MDDLVIIFCIFEMNKRKVRKIIIKIEATQNGKTNPNHSEYLRGELVRLVLNFQEPLY